MSLNSSQHPLSKTLSQYLNKKARYSGDIGFELEIEGVNPETIPIDSKVWKMKEEGSLRDGWEFVLKTPLNLSSFSSAADELEVYLKKSKIRKSIRCSTHYHVNIGKLTLREIFNVLAFYYLVENILVETQGHLRKGNLFCLRMTDAEMISVGIEASVHQGSFFTEFHAGNYKYGALNLSAITHFQSLEFRFFRPMTEAKEMIFWADLLKTMVDRARDISVEAHLNNLKYKSPVEFLSSVFTPSQVQGIQDRLGYQPHNFLKSALEDNAYYVFLLKQALRKARFRRFNILDSEGDMDSNDQFAWINAGGDSVPMPDQPTQAPFHFIDDGVDEELLLDDEEDTW